jgi:hypothetical protein
MAMEDASKRRSAGGFVPASRVRDIVIPRNHVAGNAEPVQDVSDLLEIGGGRIGAEVPGQDHEIQALELVDLVHESPENGPHGG